LTVLTGQSFIMFVTQVLGSGLGTLAGLAILEIFHNVEGYPFNPYAHSHLQAMIPASPNGLHCSLDTASAYSRRCLRSRYNTSSTRSPNSSCSDYWLWHLRAVSSYMKQYFSTTHTYPLIRHRYRPERHLRRLQ
jgi:hypothetical protein